MLNYTGNAANGARSPAIVISQPQDDIDDVAVSTQTVPDSKMADYIAWLQLHSGITDDNNTWSGVNTFGNGLVFTHAEANDQAIAGLSTTTPTHRILINLWRYAGAAPLRYIREFTSKDRLGKERTINASWTAGAPGTWVCDDPAFDAMREYLTEDGWVLEWHAGTNTPWGDSAWSPSLQVDSASGGNFTANKNITSTTGDVTATAGHVVATAGNLKATAGHVEVGAVTPVTPLNGSLYKDLVPVAWGKVQNNGAVSLIMVTPNIASVSRVAQGDVRVTLTTGAPNILCPVANPVNGGGAAYAAIVPVSTTQFRVNTFDSAGNLQDYDFFVIVHGG